MVILCSPELISSLSRKATKLSCVKTIFWLFLAFNSLLTFLVATLFARVSDSFGALLLKRDFESEALDLLRCGAVALDLELACAAPRVLLLLRVPAGAAEIR
jgi:hypothetical protein